MCRVIAVYDQFRLGGGLGVKEDDDWTRRDMGMRVWWEYQGMGHIPEANFLINFEYLHYALIIWVVEQQSQQCALDQ